MGVISSKCKSKQASNTDLGVRYEKLENYAGENTVLGPDEKKKGSKKTTSSNRTGIVNESQDNNAWDAVVPDVNHMDRCKHSKTLSLTTQVSPKSTTTTDGDDVGSISTLSSMLENPLLKRSNIDNPLIKRSDGELRPVGPVHPWKLGKDKNQVRLELEETGLLQSTKYEKYPPNIDPMEEGIIGDLRSIGIISNSSAYNGQQITESKRKLPPRLAHLSTELGKSKVYAPVTSKSEVGAANAIAVEQVNSEPALEVHEKNKECTSDAGELAQQTVENVSVELKVKIINTDIL